MRTLRTIGVLMWALLLAATGPARTQEENAQKYPPGLIVTSVTKASPAEQAGLKLGDLLLSLDGAPLRFMSQMAPLRDKARWDGKKTMVLAVRRGSDNLTLNVTVAAHLGFGNRPPLPGAAQTLYDAAVALPNEQTAVAMAKLQAATEVSEQTGDFRAASWLCLVVYALTPARTKEHEVALISVMHFAERAGDPLLAAYCLDNLGSVATEHGKLDEAEGYYQQALSIRERLSPNSFDLANSLNSLGNIADIRGKLDEAEEYHKRALAIKERLSPNSLDVAMSLNNLGNIADIRGKLDEADDYFRRALSIRERLAPDSLNVAASLNGLGVVARDRGQLGEAEAYHQRALAIKQRLAPSSPDIAISLNNLGGIAAERRRLDEADGYLKRALAIEERLVPESLAVARSLHNLGVFASERGKLDEAEEYFKHALVIQERLSPESLDVASSLKCLGGVVEQRGKLDEAEQHFQDAWQIVRRQGQQVAGDNGRQEFGKAKARYAADLLHIQLKRGRSDTAFVTLEEGRAQALVQAMNERGLTEKVTPPDVWHTYQIAQIKHNVAFKEAERADELLQNTQAQLKADQETKEPEATLQQGQKAVQEAETAFESKCSDEVRTRTEMESTWEQVRQAAKAALPSPIDPNQARKRLSPGTLFLEFSVGEKEVILFASSSEGVKAYTLPASREELEAKVSFARRFVAHDTDERGTKLVSEVSIQENALRTLFQKLFPPEVQAGIQQAKRLVLSPDDFLWDLPFAALITNTTGTPSYLGLHKPLSYAQSLTLFFAPGPPRGTPGTGTLVIGNPLYDPSRRAQMLTAHKSKPSIKVASASHKPKPASKVIASLSKPTPKPQPSLKVSSGPLTIASARRSGELGVMTRDGRAPEQLPYAQMEAEQVAREYNTMAHTGIEPTEAWFREYAPQANILHLATHGFFNPFAPQSSGILLAVPEKTPLAGQYDIDGALQAWEVWSLKLKAELVVLSACETGRGAKVTGEGLIGLTRAWQYAGAKTIVSSLWEVNDESTCALMTSFHHHLLQGANRDEALRMAMADVESKRSAGWSDPYHWAAFVLVGDTSKMP